MRVEKCCDYTSCALNAELNRKIIFTFFDLGTSISLLVNFNFEPERFLKIFLSSLPHFLFDTLLDKLMIKAICFLYKNFSAQRALLIFYLNYFV